MNKPEAAPAAGPSAPAPYRDLYIYYVEGRVNPVPATIPGFIGNWQEGDTAFLFFTEPADAHVDRLLSSQPWLRLLDTVQMPYAQWQGSVPEPLRVGRFRFIPPWSGVPEGLAADPAEETHNILLDPGVVFGNGTHPTTLHCLEALEVAFAGGRIDTVLDLGTGTGVLALGAARLGARRVVAVDNNLLAVQTARANIVRNGLTHRVVAVQGRAEDFIACSADLLVANLHDDVLRHLLGAPGFLHHKKFVLSGLLRSPAREVRRRLGRLPVRIQREWSCDGVWHTYYGTISARTGTTIMPVMDPKG